jgi:hypothetical protein
MEYYPGDEVIRTKYSAGLVGRILEQVCDVSYNVEILEVPELTRWALVGGIDRWSKEYFILLHPAADREPDWEV